MRIARIVVLALGCFLAASCVTGVEFEPTTVWEGTLVPIPPSPPLEALIAAISRGQSTQANLAVRAAPNTTYGWGIFSGTCATPSALVGAAASYAEIVTDSQGVGEVVTSVTRTLDANARYHAILYASAAPERVLACGELQRTSV